VDSYRSLLGQQTSEFTKAIGPGERLGRGKGKSGGYRVITYFAAADVPVVLLALVSKGQRADISQADRNALRAELSGFAADYRAGVKRMRRTKR
jgi:hypothetical protein